MKTVILNLLLPLLGSDEFTIRDMMTDHITYLNNNLDFRKELIIGKKETTDPEIELRISNIFAAYYNLENCHRRFWAIRYHAHGLDSKDIDMLTSIWDKYPNYHQEQDYMGGQEFIKYLLDKYPRDFVIRFLNHIDKNY